MLMDILILDASPALYTEKNRELKTLSSSAHYSVNISG